MSQLLESPHLQQENVPKLSSKSSSESYILHITSLSSSSDYYAASASSPSNVIDLFDKSSLRGVQTLPGHHKGTTSLRTHRECGLVSSGKDGCVTVWDIRSNTHGVKLMTPDNRSLLCCDISPDGSTFAAGSELHGEDAFIFYWDPRQPSIPIRTHTSTHSDDITTVSFLPGGHDDRNIVLSGSTDGLLCTSYADESDEDEAVIHVGNCGSSISQAGWIDDGFDIDARHAVIWAATDMETFSTWTGDLSRLVSVDIRALSLQNGRTWSADYLITALSSGQFEPKLGVFTGNNEGDVGLMSNMNISAPNAPWCLHKLWKKGHSSIVRSLFWDEVNHVLVTGGEDAKINAWPIHAILDEELDSEDEEEEDDVVDVKMTSPNPKKRELTLDEGIRKKRAKHYN